ncbi:MAG: CorA-like Mg2+ transporter protein [Methanomassiliicoccales archaeon PtaU1.Bin124]|nr:MAG: CorA-like Mg2+ transporter protein [Methanomassiliicoccales archaeon PtaU1.Bin124]
MAEGERCNPEVVAVGNDPAPPRFVCVTLPPAPFKIAKVTADDICDLTGIAKEGTLTWINFVADDLETDVPMAARKFGFSDALARNLVKHDYQAYEDNDIELGMVLPAIRVNELDVDVRPVVMMVRDNLIVTIHDKDLGRMVQFSRYADTWLSKLPGIMPTTDKLTLVMIRLIAVINERNYEQLRMIEDKADDISESLLDPTIHYMETGRYIYEVKHSLIVYLNALWRGLDVLNELRYGDAELVSDHPKVLQQLQLMCSEQTKHISLTEHTSTVLVSGTTVLQTLHNNQLLIINNRMLMTMTWMTIIGTAVMVPNTMATMFGFIFTAPPEHLLWSLAVIVFSTLASTWIAYKWITMRLPMAESPERLHPSDR